ncbi:chromate efflux transporter [Phenylobacterium sp. LjRoot225]|uniref:chromate efflux transporter n=1 Tax=Phenylobacterium sp. LjRoot225 TaxID=3342285 RepID=UPI003ED1508C
MDEGQPTASESPKVSETSRASEAGAVFLAFLRQGFTAFGGPVAHLGYFRREFVERRGWLGEAAFADLLALCQFLPGPASSQLAMAIGQRRAGWAGLIAAWIGFTLPAALAMIALAYATPLLNAAWGGGWRHGLKIAAAAIVAQALAAMARTLARGPVRAGMAIGAAAGLIVAHGPMAQIFALLAGAAFGYGLLRDAPAIETPDLVTARAPAYGPPLAALAVFALLLAGLPFAASALNEPLLGLASVFYRTGALVFGGGHVVLPLLQSEIVGRSWLDRDTFLAGYGAVQALPGPLFSFAAFVGAAQGVAPGGWIGGLVAVTAIFLPSLLLVAGVVPFWDRLKVLPEARGALAGVNAVVVGLLAAALWDPVLTGAVQRTNDWALVAAAYVFLAVARLPPWLVVIGFALAAGLLAR